jgi:polar amino acid transport system substrate-binding protein
MKKKYLFIMIFWSLFCFFQMEAAADELIVGFAYTKPPFVFATPPIESRFYDMRNSGLGMEVDIFRAALAFKGHTLKPSYFSYDQLSQALKDGKIDAAATVRADFKNRFYSDAFIRFHNFAITKNKNNMALHTIADLSDKSIVAWQGATHDLGKTFENTVQDNNKYREIGSQKEQCALFINDEADVLVIDKTIFKWWHKELSKQKDAVSYHDLFPGETIFLAGFQSEKMRDDFDEGLKTIKESGVYNQIISNYVD